MILSGDDLDKLRTPRGGYTRKTLEAIGIKWPPRKGWRKKLIGQEIDDEAWETAIHIAGAELEVKHRPLSTANELNSEIAGLSYRLDKGKEITKEHLLWLIDLMKEARDALEVVGEAHKKLDHRVRGLETENKRLRLMNDGLNYRLSKEQQDD